MFKPPEDHSTSWNIQTRRYHLLVFQSLNTYRHHQVPRDTFMNDIGVSPFLKLNTLQKYTGKELVPKFREYSKMKSDFVWMPNSQITHDYNSQPKHIFKKNTAPTTPPGKKPRVPSLKNPYSTHHQPKRYQVCCVEVDGLLPNKTLHRISLDPAKKSFPQGSDMAQSSKGLEGIAWTQGTI